MDLWDKSVNFLCDRVAGHQLLLSDVIGLSYKWGVKFKARTSLGGSSSQVSLGLRDLLQELKVQKGNDTLSAYSLLGRLKVKHLQHHISVYFLAFCFYNLGIKEIWTVIFRAKRILVKGEHFICGHSFRDDPQFKFDSCWAGKAIEINSGELIQHSIESNSSQSSPKNRKKPVKKARANSNC